MIGLCLSCLIDSFGPGRRMVVSRSPQPMLPYFLGGLGCKVRGTFGRFKHQACASSLAGYSSMVVAGPLTVFDSMG
jgi:hypothetical protein